MQAAIPGDIKVSYEFDQSGYVINSLKNLLFEGGLGAILTGLMVLLFLGDRRGALIVVLTIPVALLSSVIFLNMTGQTINIMTLGGLALAVGILVDEATVTIENIHRHQESGAPKARAILDACKEIVTPKLLILFSILAVFAPALFMTGMPRGMFMPMSLAVGFAMITSFVLSMSFVPVMAVRIMKPLQAGAKEHNRFEKFKSWYLSRVMKLTRRIRLSLAVYFMAAIGLFLAAFYLIGLDIFPKVDTGQVQVRLRMESGTRIERTEDATQDLLKTAEEIVGKGNVAISSAFIGTQPSSFPVNLIHLWTSGPHEAVIRINLAKNAGYPVAAFQEEMRKRFSKKYPEAKLSFEPGDLVDQVMNLGSTNPIEVAVLGKNLQASLDIAQHLENNLKEIPFFRDVQITTPIDYPGIKIDIDRVKAGQLGLTVDDIAKSIVPATSSSRFTTPDYWRDPSSGVAYQVQVEYPEYLMNKAEDIEMIPIVNTRDKKIYLRDVATWHRITTPAEYDKLNQQRFISLIANIHRKDLGSAVKALDKAVNDLGELPPGTKILKRGQVDLLNETLTELQLGLFIAIIVIFLMLAANFQSFKIALATVSILPAVNAGSVLLLLATGHTLNIQSYMGAIMAVGVAMANAILYVTNAESLRRQGDINAYHTAASNRMRPILMTSFAMIAGMIPMAIGIGEGGAQVAPLGIAVIGGLVFSLISTLLFLPLIYRILVGSKAFTSVSLNPDDPDSKYFEKQ